MVLDRETIASLHGLIAFIDSEISICLDSLVSRYQLHLAYVITRMSILYPCVPVWDLPPFIFFLPPSSSVLFYKHLPSACCVLHSSENRDQLDIFDGILLTV